MTSISCSFISGSRLLGRGGREGAGREGGREGMMEGGRGRGGERGREELGIDTWTNA